jgi:hypothetical protein
VPPLRNDDDESPGKAGTRKAGSDVAKMHAEIMQLCDENEQWRQRVRAFHRVHYFSSFFSYSGVTILRYFDAFVGLVHGELARRSVHGS